MASAARRAASEGAGSAIVANSRSESTSTASFNPCSSSRHRFGTDSPGRIGAQGLSHQASTAINTAEPATLLVLTRPNHGQRSRLYFLPYSRIANTTTSIANSALTIPTIRCKKLGNCGGATKYTTTMNAIRISPVMRVRVGCRGTRGAAEAAGGREGSSIAIRPSGFVGGVRFPS